MKACRAASLLAMAALLGANAVAACARDHAPPDVPGVTTARPDGAPVLGVSTATLEGDASPSTGGAFDSGTVLTAALAKESPVKAAFVDVPGNVEPPICSRVLVAVAKGKVVAMGETLATGDVLVVTHPDPIKLEGSGLVVVARRDFEPDACAVKTRPALAKKVVRATAAPKLEWAGGTMSAHLDVAPPANADGGGLSPELYLGRLEGTAGVAEHNHPTSWEILAAVEANGTFVLEGTEGRLGPRQIVAVPPGARHAWKPEPGSKLVAVQMYTPPGPEQRFVALAAAEKGAGGQAAGVKDAGTRDAR